MDFIGENLLPGQLGHFLAILGLVSSIVATIAYWYSFKAKQTDQQNTWLKIGRVAFAFETVAVLGMFLTLYFILSNHLFEYKYAWQHSSRNLQVEYLLSCFWEGQEGSFMLWAFWHCVLGWFVIWRSGKWEGPVMTTVSFAQFALATMLVGIYFFGKKVGSSPFVLLRNEMEAPIFSRPDYLSLVKDGNGLNALLQNYWMVIHPPVLFLGFASTIIPFAYAMGGFFTRQYEAWTKAALPWALFSAGILGLGIMMGAAWAYESLTFGGYWAWDPVENASLVPWLVLVAGVHTNLIYNHSGHSLRSTYLFYLLGFLLILYSTFLTRSGVLGDTSVHSFTDLGMNTQLLLFILVFLLPAMGLLAWHYKRIPAIAKEEHPYSREFWMFLGAMIFFFSALIIIAKTSLPVVNKVFGSSFAPPEDVIQSHNQIQIWIALVAGLLTAVTQYLRYRQTDKKVVLKKISLPLVVASLFTLAISLGMGMQFSEYGEGFRIAMYITLFAASFAVAGNLGYIWSGLKGKLKLAGGSVAHIGFGFLLLGILISAGNRTVLSINTTGISPLKATDKENSRENTTLIKGQPTDMGKFMVTYTRDTINPRDRKRYFEIDFNRKDGKEKFQLYPDVIENNKGGEGLTPNPDARHYIDKDIFAYVTFLSDPEAKQRDTTAFTNAMVAIGDTNFYSNGMWVVNGLELNPSSAKFDLYKGDTVVAADITVIAKDGRLYRAQPAFRFKGNSLMMLPDTVMSQSLVLSLNRTGELAKREVEIGIKETNSILDFITLKVYEFPLINLLWLGVMLIVIGFMMSMVQRIGQIRRSAASKAPVFPAG